LLQNGIFNLLLRIKLIVRKSWYKVSTYAIEKIDFSKWGLVLKGLSINKQAARRETGTVLF